MRISIFGSSASKPGSAHYQQAFELGHMLASAGFEVQTGGYSGVMEAVSHGASQAGGRVFGITSDEIEAWRPVPPNRWIDEELRFPSAQERLLGLVNNCRAAMALPGGIGTLAEIAVLWNQIILTAPKPLILIGPGWQHVIETLISTFPDEIEPDRLRYLSFAHNNPSALDLLTSLLPPA